MLDLTFLFTDIEGSTTLWERFPERMRGALARHDGLLHAVIEEYGGKVFKTVGDSFCAVFATPAGAVSAAAAAQHRIAAEAWEEIDGVIRDRKSTRLNSSHLVNSYAVFCLKKKTKCVSRHKPIRPLTKLRCRTPARIMFCAMHGSQ